MSKVPFDVFLSHNSADTPAADELARLLKQQGIEPWLDTWHLPPGQSWQERIEEVLAECAACAVLIGPSGVSDWQREEMRAAIDRRVKEARFPVIPVLLPGTGRPERSQLPTFLVATTWVEFRRSLDDGDALHRLISGIRGVEPGHTGALFEGECPYRGLEAFDASHARFFFGREALTEWLLEKLRPAGPHKAEPRFLAVIGPSGSGKSSLALAGLLPAIAVGMLEGSGDWPILICRPGPDPLESLAIALAGLGEQERPAPSEVRQLIADFQAGDDALHLFARLALRDAPASRRLVLLIDQFEEVFTLCSDDRKRQALIENLVSAAGAPAGRVLVVLTLRADFYGKCAGYPRLATAVADHQVLVGPLSEDELRRAIERPAHLVGCEFEAGLVETLMHDVEDQPGALPLLQYALLELWERREGRRLTLSAYKAIGELQGALENRANAILHSFTEPERELCRRIFLRLTQPGEGTEDTKRRASLRELLSSEGDAKALSTVVNRLADARLITTEGDDHQPAGEGYVEVAHEALIRGWTELRQWIDADRAGLLIHHRLSEDSREWERHARESSYLYDGARLVVAAEWAEGHRPELNPLEAAFLKASHERKLKHETDKSRAARRFMAAIGAGAALAVVLAVVAFIQRHRADVQTLLLQDALLGVKVQANNARQQTKIANKARDLAKAQTEEARWQAQLAGARRLAAQSEAVFEPYPQRSLLLATEAVRESMRGGYPAAPAGEQALRDALAKVGGVCLTGHSELIPKVVFSPDGRWLVTASWDKTARVWDASNLDAKPMILREPDAIDDMAISPDGRWLVTASHDGWARVWDMKNLSARPITLRGHRDSLEAVAFSPDGRKLVTAGLDNTARVWDTSRFGGRPIVLRGHDGTVTSLVFSPDGRRLATASEDRTVRLWDTSDFSAPPTVLRGHEKEIKIVAFSPNGRRLVTASHDNLVRVWDTNQLDHEPVVLRGHEDWIPAIAFSPGGRWLVTGSEDHTARVWDMDNLASQPVVLRGHQDRIGAVAFSPDGLTLVTGSSDHTARVWSTSSFQAQPVVLRGHEGSIEYVTFSPDGHSLVTASEDKTARVWDTLNLNAEPLLLPGSEASIQVVAFSPNARWLASAGRDGRARVWSMSDRSHQPVAVLRGHEKSIQAVAFSPNSRWLATASWDKTARLWDTSQFDAEALVLRGHRGHVNALAFSPDDRWLVTAGDSDSGRLWNLTQRGTSPAALVGHTAPVEAVAFSPDGRWLVTASADCTALVREASHFDAQPIVLRGHQSLISALDFSADGRLLATASFDETARVWNTSDWNVQPIVLRGHTDPVTAVRFSPDGRSLVTASEDKTARIWDVTNLHQQPVVLSGYEESITSLAFSTDARSLATADGSRTVRIWNLNNLRAEPIVLSGKLPVLRLAFSPDGRWLACGGPDGGLRLFSQRFDALIELASRIAGRNLSLAEWQHYFTEKPYRPTFLNQPFPRYDKGHAMIAHNLSAAEWQRHFPGQPYRKTFPDRPVPADSAEDSVVAVASP
ncbi:MAG TPA: TIR domain-containing protein [Isosphaeraceae bacterium]|jgi:WD40 repeat protein|nr:TIR domain-containing protein [Isosphaeraceae bacterium]